MFDRRRPDSFVPTAKEAAAARSGSPGRPFGRRASALPWTGASTVAGWIRLGILVHVVTLLATSAAPAMAGAMDKPSLPNTLAAPTCGPHTAPESGPSNATAIAEASQRFAIPAHWISAVIAAESGGDSAAVSPKGALGLMQIMPATWEDLRRRYGLGANPFDRRDNILGGTAYLRELYDRFGTGGFLAAYNAGPARYEAYLATGWPLGQETRAYLGKLAAKLPELHLDVSLLAPPDSHDWRSAMLFLPPAAGLAPAKRTPSDGALSRSSPAVEPAIPSHLTPQSTGLFASFGSRITP